MFNLNKIFLTTLALGFVLLASINGYSKETDKVEDEGLKCFFSKYDAELANLTAQEEAARKDGIEDSELTELQELRTKINQFNIESKKLGVGNFGAMKKYFPSYYEICAPKVPLTSKKS